MYTLSCFSLILLGAACGDDTPSEPGPPADVGDDAGTDVVDADNPDAEDLGGDEPDVSDLADAGDPDVTRWAVPDLGTDSDADAGPDVPEGVERCNNLEDDDGDGRVDCHDPDCFDRDVCEGVAPAPWLRPRLWIPTWSDEFNGPEIGNEACYDNETTPPQCLTIYWGNEDCPERALDELADLNKCNWSVFELYNWMDWNKPLGQGMNAFDPEMVTVTGGELILRATASLPRGGLGGGLSIEQVMDRYDCGTDPDEGFAPNTDCPILSGGLWSKQMGDVVGLLQQYGRFEIRARLPVGPGSFPAHWMLPQSGPWPGAGEIDIMEATNHLPNFRPFSVGANFHDGVEIETEDGTITTHMSAGSMDQSMSLDQQTDEYHVFSVEWDAERLLFMVDELIIGRVIDGTLLPNDNIETGDYVGDYPADVPDILFHMILNSTVTAFADDDYPDPRSFANQSHYIDYVRAWAVCDPAEDACPDGGVWDGANCRVGALPDRSDLFILDDDLVYAAEAGDEACPDGGTLEDDLCIVHAVEPAVATFLSGESFYIQSVCRPNTLSDSSQCHSPCLGLGESEGDRCLVGHPPEGERASIAGDLFVYSFAEGDERCPIGREHGAYCEFGAIPEGRTGWIPFDGDAFYLDAVCNPAEYMPNCPEPCPDGTRWTGSSCFVANAPPGQSAFVWEGGFYYDYLDTEVYAVRCPIGRDDGAHCALGAAPGSGAVAGDTFLVQPSCGNVPILEP
jgi:hypothetical protein